MIKITNTSLIIEIPCNSHVQPLQVLAHLQEGLINMLHTMSYADDAPKQQKSFGVQQTTNLLREMMVSSDQLGSINEMLTDNQIVEFNRA